MIHRLSGPTDFLPSVPFASSIRAPLSTAAIIEQVAGPGRSPLSSYSAPVLQPSIRPSQTSSVIIQTPNYGSMHGSGGDAHLRSNTAALGGSYEAAGYVSKIILFHDSSDKHNPLETC